MKHILLYTAIFIFLIDVSSADASSTSFILQAKDYNSCAIIWAQNNEIAHFAASELQKHLELIAGFKFPILTETGSYTRIFYVGIIPKDDIKPLQAEEARYLISGNAIYFYGEDNISVPSENEVLTVVNFNHNRTGTLFAVYNFLENELGVHWFEPGDDGIVYTKINVLDLKPKSDSWISHFLYSRGMRSYMWNYNEFKKYDKAIPKEFKMSEEQVAAKRTETDIWLKRMRMGNRSVNLPFSHSFSDWWEKYGKAHPEWFALNGNGTREPMGDADRIKMCVSNQSLVEEKVNDYFNNKDRNTVHGAIGCSENDGGGNGLAEFCHCDACLLLDHLEPGEKFGANLTDRYVNFWNRVAALGRKTDPNLVVTGYAYSVMITPPRKERLSEAIVIEVVSAFNDEWKKTRQIFEGWAKMGCKQFLFRPNDLCCDLGLPMGQEERVYRHQQLAVEYNSLGTDHDALYGFWTGISGINYYILAKSHVDPSKPFEYWENEYYSIFGKANEDIKKFHQYWRKEVFTKRLYPADMKNRESGEEGLLAWERCGGYGRDVNKYYNARDFDITDEYLQAALRKELTPVQKKLVERLIIANQHNRLTYEAMNASRPSSGLDAVKASKTLLNFRIAHKADLYLNWPLLFIEQVNYGDVCGMAGLSIADRKKNYDCIKKSDSPKIDGNLDETFWRETDTQTPFLVMPSGADPIVQTKTYLAYNNNALFIAYKCMEPKMDLVKETVNQRDGDVYQDNAIEMFFDPKKTGTDYYQIVLSSIGAMFDGASQNGKYDTGFNLEIGKQIMYAIDKGADYWTVEIMIPFGAMNITTPAPGSNMNFNLCRDRALSDGIGNEHTSLAALFASFQTPGRFATINFK
jgi:hypothetical protein